MTHISLIYSRTTLTFSRKTLILTLETTLPYESLVWSKQDTVVHIVSKWHIRTQRRITYQVTLWTSSTTKQTKFFLVDVDLRNVWAVLLLSHGGSKNHVESLHIFLNRASFQTKGWIIGLMDLILDQCNQRCYHNDQRRWWQIQFFGQGRKNLINQTLTKRSWYKTHI